METIDRIKISELSKLSGSLEQEDLLLVSAIRNGELRSYKASITQLAEKLADAFDKAITTDQVRAMIEKYFEVYAPKINVDEYLDSASKNPVSNNVIFSEFEIMDRKIDTLKTSVNSSTSQINANIRELQQSVNNDLIAGLDTKADKNDVYTKEAVINVLEEQNANINAFIDDTNKDIRQIDAKKQDKILVGKGLDLSPSNTLSCSIDLTVYRFVDFLPSASAVDPSKLYLQRDVDDSTLYIEYAYDESYENDGSGNAHLAGTHWKKIGEYTTTVDLAQYVKADDADEKFVAKRSQVLLTEEEYESLLNKDPDVMYYIYEEE